MAVEICFIFVVICLWIIHGFKQKTADLCCHVKANNCFEKLLPDKEPTLILIFQVKLMKFGVFNKMTFKFTLFSALWHQCVEKTWLQDFPVTSCTIKQSCNERNYWRTRVCPNPTAFESESIKTQIVSNWSPPNLEAESAKARSYKNFAQIIFVTSALYKCPLSYST